MKEETISVEGNTLSSAIISAAEQFGVPPQQLATAMTVITFLMKMDDVSLWTPFESQLGKQIRLIPAEQKQL